MSTNNIEKFWAECQITNHDILQQRKIKAKTILTEANKVADKIYFVQKGCLRLWYNNDGEEITLEFFFDGDMVFSVESFITGEVGVFYIEALEDSQIFELDKETYDILLETAPQIKISLYEMMISRFTLIIKRLLFDLKNTPQQRYEVLLKKRPELIRRIPQHYIASYLNITPVSLSRIRNRR